MSTTLDSPAPLAPGFVPPRAADAAWDGPIRLIPETAQDDPGTIVVPNHGREIRVGFAREPWEYQQAFGLLAVNYQSRGYHDPDSRPFRFTPYHILPETATFVARDAGRVVATMSLVPDTRLLGLPMESIFGPEVASLRGEGRRLGEVTSLADRDLSPREFLPVFMALIRLTLQYHLRRGGDTWALTVNPRHAGFYRKVLGAVPVGGSRSYPSVNGHPAEAFWLDRETLRTNVPAKHREFFAEDLPVPALTAAERGPGHVRYFCNRSDLAGRPAVEEMLRTVELFGSPPRWDEVMTDDGCFTADGHCAVVDQVPQPSAIRHQPSTIRNSSAAPRAANRERARASSSSDGRP